MTGLPHHELVPVQTEHQWSTYHRIRQQVLFEARGRFGIYDENHPDEYLPHNHPMLLYADGSPVAVVRIDARPPVAYLRRVAVQLEVQRQGHGSALLALAQRWAISHGCTSVKSNVAMDAVPFYLRCGFERDRDVDASPSVAMVKVGIHQ